MAKGTAKEIVICGRKIKLGDKLKVRYTGGRFQDDTIQGEVIELWENKEGSRLQARLSNGWCFHDNDIILI
ncbi:hypothetical protein LCGC14_2787380 [marine sediment metagenome]|uniref:KOW domain-containing protein n=1 Tax=marine sediment metagenome TaxID=412755 RepID=A0A0F9BI29_9ZZZZ